MMDRDGLATFLTEWRRRYALQTRDPFTFRPRLQNLDAVVAALLDEVDFQELRLTDWLGTPDGQLIESVVLSLVPPPQAAEARLLVEAIAVAARARQRGRTQVAGLITVGLASFFVYMWIASVRGSRRG